MGIHSIQRSGKTHEARQAYIEGEEGMVKQGGMMDGGRLKKGQRKR